MRSHRLKAATLGSINPFYVHISSRQSDTAAHLSLEFWGTLPEWRVLSSLFPDWLFRYFGADSLFRLEELVQYAKRAQSAFGFLSTCPVRGKS